MRDVHLDVAKKTPKRFILGARISWGFTKSGFRRFVRLLEQLREFIRLG